jgi:uncharacterized membrane protein YraQ (UPF0718 family)
VAGGAVEFFVFDTLKIFILLLVIIFAVSLLRSFISGPKVRAFLSRQNPLAAHLMAAGVGVVTPFCSCSAVPLFLGFVQSGVPLGVTFSFLVASPMVNEVALVMLWGLFGWQVALIYLISGLAIAVVSGLAIGAMRLESLVQDFVLRRAAQEEKVAATPSWPERLRGAWGATAELIGKIWIYILLGVGVGAWIHGAVPTELVAQIAGPDKWFGVPLATALGVPLYSNAVGVIR